MTIFAPGATFRASAATLSRSGPTTTTTSPAAASSTAESVCASIERPASSCRTLGRTERMRTPSPAASTMVRQRRALALMGRFISHQAAVREARCGGAESLADSFRLAQYRRGRPRFPAAGPHTTSAVSPRGQNASRCAAKNDIQPTRQGWNAPGLRRGFLLRADFSCWLGATPCRAVLTRSGSVGERTKNTMADRQRREFLQLAVGGALAASLAPSGSSPAAAEPLGQPVPFSVDTVVKMAVELASKPFKAPEAPLPSIFSDLTLHQYASIRRVPGAAIWSDQKLGFSLEPLHRGFVYTTPIAINIVENGMAQKVIYDAADFDFGKLQPPAVLGDLGFSGLRILKASDQGFEDVAIFQGATFYRARAGGQPFGVTARGLAIRTGDEPGEEFPLFREFWIEKPNPAANTLTLHALLDSASVTGAFRFTLRPLEATIIDTRSEQHT